MPQTRLNSPIGSNRTRVQSYRTTPSPDHQALWRRDQKRSTRRRESPVRRSSGDNLVWRRSRTRYLINFLLFIFGGCKLIYCPRGTHTVRYSVSTGRGTLPDTGHAETATCGLTSFSDVTDVTLTSSQLGIVTKFTVPMPKQDTGRFSGVPTRLDLSHQRLNFNPIGFPLQSGL